MRVCQVLMLIFVLWDGRPDVTRAETYSAAEGENFTVTLEFSFNGDWKIFCKNDCNKTENILVQTSENRQKNGRYSIEYEYEEYLYSFLSVSITNVSRSDSGRYSCGLENWSEGKLINKEYKDFMIKVTNGTPLYVGLTVAAAVILLSVTLFILFRKKRVNKPKEPAATSENTQLHESNCLYEEIPDKISQSRPRPVEISTVYVSASFSNTTEQTSHIYSLASEPSAQLQPEDVLSKVTYSELDFTKSSGVVVHTAQTEAVYNTIYNVFHRKNKK